MTTIEVRRSAGFSDQQLLRLLAVAGGLVVGIFLFLGSRSGSVKAKPNFPIEWAMAPVWSSNPDPKGKPLKRPNAVKDLAIYLDVSRPLGGFLPSESNRLEQTAYQALVSQIPAVLVRESGSTSSHLTWRAVASTVEPMDRPEPLLRSRYIGVETRLDLAIAELVGGFSTGRLRTAVLVTDLIATNELTGAMGAGKALADWMTSSDLRHGTFHLGLLGVRAEYRGIEISNCAAREGLGCRFSEQLQHWVPLTRAVELPFYVLVLGRNAKEVDAIGEGLQKGIGDSVNVSRWERLSAGSESRKLRSTCTLRDPARPGREQFALVREADGSFRCDLKDIVEIACALPNAAGFSPESIATTWPEANVRLSDAEAVISLDCGSLRDRPPTADLSAALSGPPPDGSQDEWSAWSTENDATDESIGKTLQLTSFLATVRPRPESYRLTSSSILKGAKQ